MKRSLRSTKENMLYVINLCNILYVEIKTTSLKINLKISQILFFKILAIPSIFV